MWTVRNYWKKVIFSDETKIEIGNNRKVYVWRKVDERLRPECHCFVLPRLMAWGIVHLEYVGACRKMLGNDRP
jgi:hypothetical protein